MKYFLDCGSNLGQGYEKLRHKYKCKLEDFHIYMFEPNIVCYEVLKNNYPDTNKYTLLNKAVSDYDGSALLNIEFCDQKKDWVGGATNILEPEDFRRYFELNPSKNYFCNAAYRIECINLSNFVKNLSNIEHLIIKLDIEGTEFIVLDKMIEDNTLSLVKEIYIEWHDRFFTNSNKVLTKYLEAFKKHNIAYGEWE